MSNCNLLIRLPFYTILKHTFVGYANLLLKRTRFKLEPSFEFRRHSGLFRAFGVKVIIPFGNTALNIFRQ